MAHSNSSLNCFSACMAKYEHCYIKHTPPCKPPSPHLTFGTMAHEVLYKAGCLRDEQRDGVSDDEYYTIIPSEVIHNDLKQYFSIKSWESYFKPIIKQVAKYESELLDSFNSDDIQIEREVKLQIIPAMLEELGYPHIKQSLVGVIDCLIYSKTEAVILDYKFSSERKGQDDFDMNSQLQLYALLIHINYDIPLHNIRIGYIDIPKQMFGQPTMLSNGTLSRSKSQNVSQDLYEKAVIAIHGDDSYYNCKPGGHYYDCWCHLALNKCAYLSIQYLDEDAYEGITKDLLDTAKMIDFMVDNKMRFLKKYDAYTCKNCEYLQSCKTWLSVYGD